MFPVRHNVAMEPKPIDRRTFIQRSALLAGAASVPAWAGCIGPLPTPGPIVRRDPDTDAMVPFVIEELVSDAVQVRTGEFDGRAAALYKVRVATLEASTAVRNVNTGQYALPHPTEPEHAIIAYDGTCTHLGYTVGWNHDLGESQDVPDYAGGRTPGGPGALPLPPSAVRHP